METKLKRARTEALFREVNERIAETAKRFEAETAEFVCECGDSDCTHRIEASLQTYEDVRDDATTFLLLTGHEDPDIERVVERYGHFAVVEKFEKVVAKTVRRLNPRAASA